MGFQRAGHDSATEQQQKEHSEKFPHTYSLLTGDHCLVCILNPPRLLFFTCNILCLFVCYKSGITEQYYVRLIPRRT